MEITGIEPVTLGWKPRMLPLAPNLLRSRLLSSGAIVSAMAVTNNGRVLYDRHKDRPTGFVDSARPVHIDWRLLCTGGCFMCSLSALSLYRNLLNCSAVYTMSNVGL